MNAIRLVYDAVPDTLPVPPSMRRRHVEVVFLALDEELAPNQDEAVRPDSPEEILEQTAVALPELPERDHHGRPATRVPVSARGRLTIVEDDEAHLNDFAQCLADGLPMISGDASMDDDGVNRIWQVQTHGGRPASSDA